MNTPIDDYLERLDIILGTSPTSLKLKLIDDVKDQIQKLVSANPGKTEDQCISLLDEPEIIALSFMKKNNLLEHRPRQNSFLKWMAIFSMSAFGFVVLICLIVFYIYQTQPMINFNEEKNKLEFFGGIFDINTGSKWQVNQSFSGDDTNTVRGQRNFSELQKFYILFINAELNISTHKSSNIIWNCELPNDSQSQSDLPFIEENKTLTLELSGFEGSNCNLIIPETLELIISGTNARIKIINHRAPLQLNLANGVVTYAPHLSGEYKYDLHVNNGQFDTFQSSESQNALLIKIHLQNGTIKN